MGLIQKVFGTQSEKELKRISPLIDKIESLRPQMMEMSDEGLREKTQEFKKRLGEGETLDDLLPEAFAVVREAARRALQMEPVPGAADRRCDSASGADRRDADPVKENLGLHAAGVLECVGRKRRSHRDRQ